MKLSTALMRERMDVINAIEMYFDQAANTLDLDVLDPVYEGWVDDVIDYLVAVLDDVTRDINRRFGE